MVKNKHKEISTGGYQVGCGSKQAQRVEGLLKGKAWGMGLRPIPQAPTQRKTGTPKIISGLGASVRLRTTNQKSREATKLCCCDIV